MIQWESLKIRNEFKESSGKYLGLAEKSMGIEISRENFEIYL